MSYDEAERLMDEFEKWDSTSRKRDFIDRMEHKLHRKEKLSRKYR